MSSFRQIERSGTRHPEEEGFMLVFVVVLVAIVLILLAVAAPVVAKSLRRDKELESQHRAEQYVRAIQLYYRKNKSYPASIKALENTNNIRYLRHQYVDPLTGKSDWKLIHLGEQKTKIHVFFGKDLGELSAGLGSAAGLASPGQGGVGAVGPTTVNSSNALNAGFGGSTIGGSSGSTGTSGTSGATGSTGFGGGAFGDGTGGIIVGVQPNKSGDSITNPNQQTTYETWEFWYDPRIELLKQSVSITGGGVASQSASSFGKDATSGQPSSTTGAFGATGSTGPVGTPVTPQTNPFP
jgi:type II secretory pathway pseudopilin PulG